MPPYIYTYIITKLRGLENSSMGLMGSSSSITNPYLIRINEFAMGYWRNNKT
jgi:hypothetical protein